ncbi:hypothetical protein NPIL_164611 [Nephila pilipes]|uniref:Uncharacterized protein n=1 Tax=Nephila pilipes TaxID=299642 RepID=A0A8X6Q4F6_NEPPI|nr:hypothetical protein NPIL_164611 [Nephila pilipes]
MFFSVYIRRGEDPQKSRTSVLLIHLSPAFFIVCYRRQGAYFVLKENQRRDKEFESPLFSSGKYREDSSKCLS